MSLRVYRDAAITGRGPFALESGLLCKVLPDGHKRLVLPLDWYAKIINEFYN